MKRLTAALAASGVIVAGAAVASTITSGRADAGVVQAATAEMAATPDADDSVDHAGSDVGPREAALDEVIAGLVADGTLTDDQAATVKERLVEARREWAADRRERRADRLATREQIRGFLEDDVITADELAELPEDHPLRDPDGPFADAIADGQVTRDEFAAVTREHRRDRRDRLHDDDGTNT